ncbi:hypothetical protein JG688_00006514 [Phytophthora aleatoria]|uniref:Helitron helicase-like domain-containing protein n=1 Tax=Phytophthora aleatoria TaxID=2496075 RepID=A0A8J5IQL6_9STRA|nr:hypothetical protein JG688_00006514 [Phytophthora aleatoria]
MEARLIGLGISFTTCVNLHSDGQEFTRGNSINYWNNVVDTVLDLPRPIRKCGIVYLKTRNNNAAQFFRVRPDLVRRALCWLIDNNPLYKNVRISEENLAALKQFDINADLPSVSLSDDEAQVLVFRENEINQRREERECRSLGTQDAAECVDHDHIRDENNHTETSNAISNDVTSHHASVDTSNICEPSSDSPYCASESNFLPSAPRSHSIDPLDDLVESFELERNDSDTQTELQRIVEAANLVCADDQYPVKELQRQTDPINEYKTKLNMQSCFPTLFPNGEGGYHAIDGEMRTHEYQLAEFCAHMVKWPDRRFVIHSNFKFFCLNLIQRRQIDGLVRSVSETNGDCDDESGETNTDTAKAIQLLESLKPFFRVVRGSGMYWASVRDDLMSMIGSRVLPARFPAFFLTLSAADTVWPEFFEACNPKLTLDECRHLPSKERRRYLNENPDIAARFFHSRFRAFFDHILCGHNKPLGEIEDLFGEWGSSNGGPPISMLFFGLRMHPMF